MCKENSTIEVQASIAKQTREATQNIPSATFFSAAAATFLGGIFTDDGGDMRPVFVSRVSTALSHEKNRRSEAAAAGPGAQEEVCRCLRLRVVEWLMEERIDGLWDERVLGKVGGESARRVVVGDCEPGRRR